MKFILFYRNTQSDDQESESENADSSENGSKDEKNSASSKRKKRQYDSNADSQDTTLPVNNENQTEVVSTTDSLQDQFDSSKNSTDEKLNKRK